MNRTRAAGIRIECPIAELLLPQQSMLVSARLGITSYGPIPCATWKAPTNSYPARQLPGLMELTQLAQGGDTTEGSMLSMAV